MTTATAIRNPQSVPEGCPSVTIRNRSRAAEFLKGTAAAGLAGVGRASDGKLYPITPEGVSDEIATDIAERRTRPTSADVNRRVDHTRIRDKRMTRPTGPSIYEIFCKPRGLSAACATCDRQVERGGNCPGREPGTWNREHVRRIPYGRTGNTEHATRFVPDCHSLHDADREAVQVAMDEREAKDALVVAP